MNKKLSKAIRPSMGAYFAFLILFVIGAVLVEQYTLALAEAGLSLVLFLAFLLHRQDRNRRISSYVRKATAVPGAGKDTEIPFPVAVLRLGDNAIMSENEAFRQVSGLTDSLTRHTIDDAIPGFDTDWLASGRSECPAEVTLGGRRYRVYGTSVRGPEASRSMLGVLYFADLTELYQVRDEYIRSRPVVSIILVDNYDEITKNVNEGAISSLDARLNEAITKWTEGYHGLLRRLEKNRYLFVFEKQDLKSAVEEKFSILEEVHAITSPSGLAASLSFGLGVDGANFDECYNFASLAIEMCLSRGGDQAVVKDRYNFSFYGGRTRETERHSKVRSRVTANSLMELIGQSSQVFVMGHKNADLDAVGAAMGICCLCRKKGKKASIVLDLENNSSQDLIAEIRQVPEYRDVFISAQEALLTCDNHSTLVVVDTNRPDQVESRNLLESISKVCVVDHHRRAADYINPVVVNLHEPFASSASELVTEILQYAVEKRDVLPIEAKSLLAGIFLDTKSFHVRTGERTFEAAAMLRQLGAETVDVKKLLQNDFQETMAKYQIIKSARLYRQEIAIAALNSGTTRVLAAQAADELLNISGIGASFVLYPDGETVVISARSIGNANVQMILEPLGGGGNAATAGAQVKHSTVKNVLDDLVASIDRFYEG